MSDVTLRLSIPLPRDRQGFLALRCPDAACRMEFQVLPGTGRPTSTHTCPYCSREADVDTFRREEDLAVARDVGIASLKEHASAYADDLLRRKLAAAFRGNRLVSVRLGVPVSRPRPPRRVVYPDLDLETEVTCDGCGLTFRVYGVFGRCPDCANINAFVVLDADMTMCERRLARSAKALDEGHPHEANDMLWLALSNAVAAFDALGTELRTHHPTRFPARPKNLFQNLAALDEVLGKQFGSSLVTLCGPQLEALVLGFQARHLHEHNHDVVDEDFLSKTGANAALRGRKYKLKEAEVAACIAGIRHLAGAIRVLLEGATPTAEHPSIRLSDP